MLVRGSARARGLRSFSAARRAGRGGGMGACRVAGLRLSGEGEYVKFRCAVDRVID